MTYNKDVTFPYPILSPFTDDYDDKDFYFDIKINDLGDNIGLEIDYTLQSEFISNLIKLDKAKIILLINAKDSRFYSIPNNHHEITIPKSRLMLSTRSEFQLAVVSNQIINMEHNDDLNIEFNEHKRNIYIKEKSILALSKLVKFDGEISKPFELFKTQVKEDQKSYLNIILDDEYITLSFRDKKYKYVNFNESKSLNYHYVYMGLQKALLVYVLEAVKNGSHNIVYVDKIEEPDMPVLRKLHNFLIAKSVKDVSIESIDEAIEKISDRVLEKHYSSIVRLRPYED